MTSVATNSPLGRVPAGWKLVHLKDMTTKIGSGATPRGGDSVYLRVRDKATLIRSQNVFDRHFDPTGLAFISDRHAKQLAGVAIQPGDVLLNITGDGITFGRACLAPTDILPAYVNQHVSIIRPDPTLCNSGFLLNYLTHPLAKGYIEAFNAGGSRRAITKGHIESFVVPLPPLPQQEAIASTLGAFDDKIELNRRMNATLEALARAIFQSWFVDFDPVRAKAEGRQPAGMDAATAALFPDRFEDSALGEVPQGWHEQEIGDFCEVVDCLHAKKPERQAEGKPFLQLANIGGGGILDMSDTFLVNEVDYEKWTSRIEASPGDCVITNVGRVGAVAQIPVGVRAALGRNMTAVRCKVDFPYPTFLIECLLSEKMRDEIRQKTDTGTILDALNVRNIPRLRCLLPITKVLDQFEALARPLRARIEMNVREMATLAEIRDALLPRLMSGKLSEQVQANCTMSETEGL